LGDETKQFASLFSSAVRDLSLLAGEATHAEFEKAQGPGLVAAVHAALDAVAAVYETGTDAVRDWPRQRKRALAQVAAMRGALDRSGVDDELRRLAGDLVKLIGPRRRTAR
jgi:hypothetical protein